MMTSFLEFAAWIATWILVFHALEPYVSRLVAYGAPQMEITAARTWLAQFDADANGNRLTIGRTCSPQTPCTARVGAASYRIDQSAVVTMSPSTGPVRPLPAPLTEALVVDAFVYIAAAGGVVVGYSTAGGPLTCERCSLVAGVTQFPTDSIPLWRWNGEWRWNGSQWAGAWDEGGSDFRAGMSSSPPLIAGLGMQTATDPSGRAVVAINTAIVGTRVAVPATASSPCIAGSWATDSSWLYLCVQPDTWRRAALAAW